MPSTLSVASPRSTPEPFGAPLQVTESPVEVRTDSAIGVDTLESANTRGQLQWEKHMKDVDLQRRYRKVSVLIIHWEKEGNAAFDAHEEVGRLRETFIQKFKYKVFEKKLNTTDGRSAQVQIQYYLANFVYHEDAKDTLLVIYYAGHGTPDSVTGRLLLAGGNLPAPEEIPDRLSHVVWQEAEYLIHSAHRADIFLILDCCHAGRLLNIRGERTWSERIFEFLGAAGAEETTLLPGPNSFTSALIWALEELVKEREPFITSELLEKILLAPNFPRGQTPCHNELGIHCPRRLILEPLTDTPPETSIHVQRKSEETATSMEYCLNLQFLLPSVPGDHEIEKMCEGLKSLIKTNRFPARQILWKGLYSKESSRTEMPRVVREWLLTSKVKSLQRKLRTISHGKAHGTAYSPDQQCANDETGAITPTSLNPALKRSNDDLAVESEDDNLPDLPVAKRQKEGPLKAETAKTSVQVRSD